MIRKTGEHRLWSKQGCDTSEELEPESESQPLEFKSASKGSEQCAKENQYALVWNTWKEN